MHRNKFFVGQIVYHKRFDYRGLVFGVDAFYSNSDEWYEVMAVSRPPKDQPWYHVLVDNSPHTTYVAERNLSQGSTFEQINHPLLGQFFHCFNGKRYLPK